jgi:uncharacterized protein (DUF1330 family)
MKSYTVVELDITDDSWVQEYAQNVTKMIEKHGGKYLARTTQIEKIEGTRKPPQLFVIIEWPSKEAAITFYESAEYRPYRSKRHAGAKNELHLVAGEDVTKTAHLSE